MGSLSRRQLRMTSDENQPVVSLTEQETPFTEAPASEHRLSHVNGTSSLHVNGTKSHHINGATDGPIYDHLGGNAKCRAEAINVAASPKLHEGSSSQTANADGQTGLGEDAPIAICGMACRLPGGLRTPQQLWNFLLAKGDARSRVPQSRYNISAYHSTSGRPGTIATEYGYFLDDDESLGALDSSRFSLTRAELEGADPQLRRMLEVVRECFDDAGEVGFKGRSIGCYIGSYGEDWLEMQNRDPLQSGPYRVDGYSDFMLSNRVSYEMDIRGPSMTVRTACSSSLVGLHEACLAVQRGDCEAAIVGGANLILTPAMTAFMTEKGVLSADGSCKTFSADANGYARGEAITAVYVKPLAAAVRDGNPVRAVIRSTMINSDGKTPGILHPSTDTQESMIRAAYRKAGITDFSQTTYVECHGTGTAIGDPIEVNAVARVFGDTGVFIGSVKPNLGHSEGASGLTSLMKAVLALEHQTIPPNIKFTSPNPKIPFEERNLTVPLEPIPWPATGYERVSVNSFGIGGTNAHVIIDSARSIRTSQSVLNSHETVAPDDTRTQPGAFSTAMSQLIPLSANSSSSLLRMKATFQALVNGRCNEPNASEYLHNLAYTLSNRREHLTHRAFIVARSDRSAVISSGRRIAAQRPNLVMVFTGQGAQWPRMGRELLMRSDLSFRKCIHSLDEHLRDAQAPATPPWTLEGELTKPPRTSGVQTAELSQPLCTAVQIALIELFKGVGIEPAAVVGHSSGEIAAAYATGALTAREAIIVAWQRGLTAKQQTKPGAMAAIGLSREDVKGFLSPNVVVACENSHKSITLSGDASEIHAAVAQIQRSHPEALARLLKVDKAYHSHHMQEIGEKYRTAVQVDVVGKPPRRPFFSSVTGELETGPLDAAYWQKNLESTVLFRSAVTRVVEETENVAFLEVGPHPALAGPLRQILAEVSSSAPYVSAMTRGDDCVESFLNAVGKLFELNVPVDFSTLTQPGRCLSDLPPYAWDHETEHWKESRMSHEWRFRQFPSHPLLGVRQLETTSLEPSWRNLLHVDKDASWLRDHQIEDNMILPCAGYLAMAGEAMRQLSGVQGGFTLRNVVLSAALILAKRTQTELVTNFRPLRLTDSLDSEWWEFTISSYNGHMWIKHCDGQARSESSEPVTMQDVPFLPRKLESLRYYNHMDKAGLQFGPHFRLLQDARCGITQDIATANLRAVTTGDEEHYHLHPTTLDAVIQSVFFAALKGHADAKLYRRVPTKIGTMTLHRSSPHGEMKLLTAATLPQSTGDIIGHSQKVIQDNKVILQMDDLRLSPLQAVESAEKDMSQHPARLIWAPHIDFQDVTTLIKPTLPRHLYTPLLDELARLCIVYSHRHTKGDQAKLPHMQKYQGWIQDQVKALVVDDNQHQGIMALDDHSIMQKIDVRLHELSGTPVVDCAVAMQKVVLNISGLVSGQTEAQDLFSADDTLEKMYVSMGSCDKSEFIRYLGHTKPNMRILEIGAGTGTSTASILQDLSLPGPTPHNMFSRYTFTDISTALFASVKDSLKEHSNIDYRTLDINRPPSEQGFDGEMYDLIIATHVLHTTRSLGESLRNVRTLLAPEGKLLLHDLHSTSKWPNFVLGILPDWWCGSLDGRANEPYVTPYRWKEELTSAGFDRLDAVILDGPEPHQLGAVIVATTPAGKVTALETLKKKNTMTLLYDESDATGHADALSRQLQDRGYDVHRCHLGDTTPESQDVLCLLDYDCPFFENISEARYKAFQSLVQTLGTSGMMWVTRPSHVRCSDPRYAQSIGAARTIRTEMLADFATCEVDDIESSLGRLVDVFARFQRREEDESLKPEFEYVIDHGIVLVSRLYPFSLKEQLISNKSRPEDHEDTVRLDMTMPGRLTSLQWLSHESKLPAKDEVEVQIHAAGLNFRDVLCALGVVPFPEQGLGLESSGIVSKVGSEVRDLRPGDRVMLLGNGSFATHIIVCEKLCEKIPDNLTFEDAATMPAVFATAVFSLFNIGRLQKGQSVLIHSACGGVGLAAIQLARMVGAEIYATVGSQEKVAYLIDTIRLPRNRIFSSRDSTFVEALMRETQGKGVDLVLNSLSGDLLHATWRCVAEFGTMVEIGKRDLLGAGRLDMDVFLANRTYSCLDLDDLRAKRPDVVKELLRLVMGFYQKDQIAPIRPISKFDATLIQDAYRYMQQGHHLGKIVISIRGADGTVNIANKTQVQVPKKLQLNNSASYLLVGGLGGLGRSVSRYLVEHGTRRLLFLSRSAGQGPDDADFVRELESMGCEVCLIKGSVTSADDVSRAIEAAGPFLKGIMQCTMVLRDVGFPDMTFDDWTAASEPKVRGTWLLHDAALAAGLDLDFFLVFSSLSGTLGTPGQANYAGANTFLDAFVQYRTSLGLAAASINIGAVMDVGAASLDDHLMQRMEQACALGVMELELLQYISAALTTCSAVDKSDSDIGIANGFVDKHTFIIGLGTTLPLSNPENRAFHRKDRRMALYHNDTGSSNSTDNDGSSGDSLKAFLARVKTASLEEGGAHAMLRTNETVTFLAREIGRKLFSFLLRSEEDLNTAVPLSQLGMDSLVSIEMRSWWRQALGFDITVLELLGMGNLDALGRHAAEGIGKTL
ncbi:polyketide synthase [Acrodontium crateriforme]|uniref:Polyketide synthase n=1 Tax=Acrodontium crateriforme TaxID=150365 RepID=A0AAQ3MBZ0_9PEZI|nr:polyketide synthase [Acrodontium crateriforme]